jgi:hypothetical protein
MAEASSPTGKFVWYEYMGDDLWTSQTGGSVRSRTETSFSVSDKNARKPYLTLLS